MDLQQLDTVLRKTLDDRRLSRSERKALAEILDDLVGDERDLEVVRSRAFAMAGEMLHDHRDGAIVSWLEEVVKLIDTTRAPRAAEQRNEVWFFSPGPQCVGRIVSLLEGARLAADICVFTITDNRISQAVLAAHERGIRVRIITDDSKAMDLGSDVPMLAEAGIPVAIDRSPAHMHHKFAVIDRTLLVTGSYNWTRSAANDNHENLIISDNPQLVRRFADEFDRLWKTFRSRDYSRS